MLYLSGYCSCLELNLLMGKALKSETRNEYDMTGDSVMNVEVFDAGSNSNNISLVKHSAMGGQFVSFKELSLGSSKISQVFHGCVHEAGRCHRGEKLPAQIPSAREGRSEAKLNIGVQLRAGRLPIHHGFSTCSTSTPGDGKASGSEGRKCPGNGSCPS
jgi:hypothetical protein